MTNDESHLYETDMAVLGFVCSLLLIVGIGAAVGTVIALAIHYLNFITY